MEGWHLSLGKWHWGICFSDGLGRAGFDDLKGLFQIKHFCESVFGADIMLSNHVILSMLSILQQSVS